MEEMSVPVPIGDSAARAIVLQGSAPRDLRDWIEQVEAIGQLKRITGEVD